MELPELGKFIPPYLRTFEEKGGLYINDYHAHFASCPLKDGTVIDSDIPGWQRREDILKLYELAYFVEGDILELGCYRGLSTTTLAQAMTDAKKSHTLTSVDNQIRNLLITWKNLARRRLKRSVRLRWGDAREVCGKLIRATRRFGLVFVDDSHSYDSVLGVCRLLPDLLIDGGFCLFHDYNDSRNNDPNDGEYGVARAIRDGMPNETFEFYGIFGCTVLFRKRPAAS